MKKDLLGFEFHSHYNFPTKYLNFYSDSRKSLTSQIIKMRFPGLYLLAAHVSALLGYYRLISWSWCPGLCAALCEMTPWWSAQARGPVLRACRLHHYNIITPVHWSPSTHHPVITTWRIDMKNNLPRMANDTHLSSLSLQCQWRSPLPHQWPGDLCSGAQCWVTIRLSRGCNDLLRLCCNVMCNVLCVTCDRTRYNVRDIVTLIPKSQLTSHKAHG